MFILMDSAAEALMVRAIDSELEWGRFGRGQMHWADESRLRKVDLNDFGQRQRGDPSHDDPHRLQSLCRCHPSEGDTLEVRFLSVEEVMRTSDELAAQPPYDLLVRLAAFTGLRIGEVAALRVRDIDLGAGEVQVRLNKTTPARATRSVARRAKRGDAMRRSWTVAYSAT